MNNASNLSEKIIKNLQDRADYLRFLYSLGFAATYENMWEYTSNNLRGQKCGIKFYFANKAKMYLGNGFNLQFYVGDKMDFLFLTEYLNELKTYEFCDAARDYEVGNLLIINGKIVQDVGWGLHLLYRSKTDGLIKRFFTDVKEVRNNLPYDFEPLSNIIEFDEQSVKNDKIKTGKYNEFFQKTKENPFTR